MGVMELVHELRLCGVCMRRLPERGAEPAYCRQELSQLFHKYGLKHFYKSCAECYTNVQSALKLMEETRRAQIILRKIRIHHGKIRSNIELKTKIKGWISRHRREHLKKQVNSCTHRCVQCEGSDDGGSSDVEEVHTVIKQEPIEYCEVEQNNDRIVNKAEVAIKVERDALTEGKTSPDNIFCETENPPSPIMFVEVELTDHVKNEPATAVDPASSVKEQFSEGKNYNNEQNATVSMYTKRQEEEEDNEGSESKREESADFGPDDNATVMESGCEIPASVLTLVECIKISERERLAELESKRQRDSFQNAMYKCDKCGLGFRFQETLDRHMKQHSKKYGEHYCEMCDLYFQRREVLVLHRARHYTRYRCTLCPFVKMEKRACVMHCIQQHYDLQFKCDQCPKHFRKPYALMRHVKSVHATSNEQLQCPLCDKWLKSNHAYRTHIENHTRSTAYHACTKCHKRFASAPLLAAHLHQCAESRGVCCEHCGLVVKSKYILTTHMERKHSGGNGSDSRFVCDLCGRSFLNKADMRTHITWVHMRRGLKCPHCDKSFRSNCTRKRHIQKVHEKQEAVKDKFCDVCGKGFATNSTLKIHRRSHTGERPYKCSKCTQKFAQSGTMWTHHRLVHEKAKWKDLIQKRRKCDE